MSTVEVYQAKVRRRLAEAGLVFDEIDSYGPMVSAKLRADKVNQPPRFYAYGVLDVFPQGEVYDYFRCRALDGHDYLVVRFTPGALNVPRPEPIIKVERQWVKPGSQPPRSAELTSKPAPAKPKPAPKLPDPRPTVDKAPPDKGLPWTAGQIAWAVIPKADGSRLKQARCKVVAVGREQVEVEITKTGRVVRVPATQLFDHVPQLVGQAWQ